ncbi:unnamed protein product [Polarella glacialis]|nr:unnamed protein product [Polarella glacialis]
MTGFWPDYMEFFMTRFRAEYGIDIVLERVWQTGTAGTEMVLNGTVHMTEPYYIYETLYKDLPKKWSHEFSCVVMGYQQNFFCTQARDGLHCCGAHMRLSACGLPREHGANQWHQTNNKTTIEQQCCFWSPVNNKCCTQPSGNFPAGRRRCACRGSLAALKTR